MSSTPFTTETFFEWLMDHRAAVPENEFDYPLLPAINCVSNYGATDSSGFAMYPAALNLIYDESESYGEPAYSVIIKGEETFEGMLVLSGVEEGTFIDTVTEV